MVWDEDLHVKVMNKGKWAFYSVSMKYKAPYMVNVQMPGIKRYSISINYNFII